MNIEKYINKKKKKENDIELKNIHIRCAERTKETMFKQYVYSFLRWLKEQNPEYQENLEPHEISNYFIHEIVHPVWFDRIINEMPKFAVMVQVNDIFEKYSGEDIFDYIFTIVPKEEEVEYTEVELSETMNMDREISDILKREICCLSQKTKKTIMEEELENISSINLEYLLSVLLAEEYEVKGEEYVFDRKS